MLVLGTTEHQVRVLAELDPDEVAEHLPETISGDVLTLVPADGEPIELPAPRPAGAHRAAAPAVARLPPRPAAVRPTRPEGALTGSVLSTDTWRQALAAATGKAS